MFVNTDFLRNEEIYLRLTAYLEGDKERQWAPSYNFLICRSDGIEVGECDFRVGHSRELYYGGNIGYTVIPEYRGRYYAGKACLLLFELARKLNMDYLIITCNPDNIPSRKTCEYTGAVLKEIAVLPEDNDMYLEGERRKCIYEIRL